ncbi:MAG: tetratricopeptide repeat protein [Nannocystaceae bacterium]
MECPEENVIVDFVRGELPREARTQLETHIDECEVCSMVVAEMARLFADDAPDDMPELVAEPESEPYLRVSPASGPSADLVQDPRLADTDGAFSPSAVTQSAGEILVEPAAQLPQGAKLGRYVVIDRVGAGGMGVVYAAYDPELDRKVALKVLRRGAVASTASSGPGDKQRDRLMREAQAMAKLSHPNVITVHDVGTFEGQVFLAMEFIDGQTLGAWIKAEPRSWLEVLEVFAAAGRGLAAAHAVDLVHRDFKPDNVLIGRDGRVLVTDFGLARPAAGKTGSFSAVGEIPSQQVLTASLTQTGALVGTPAYMAPEQLAGNRPSPLTDQFSFCVALYEGLYGQRPFRGRSFAELASNVTSGTYLPPPRTVTVPRRVRRALFRGLATDPSARFESMDQLIDALRHDPWRPWRRWGTVVLPAGLFLVGAVAYQRSQAPPDGYCDDVDEQLVGVWDDDRREAVRTAFLATERPFARDALDATVERLDAYAVQWAQMQTDACRDQLRGEQPQAVLALRMHCLTRRRASLRAVADVLADADAAMVEGAIDAARGLTSLTTCEDLDALTHSVPPPSDDPQVREAVVELERRIDEGRALRDAAKFRETIELMEPAVAEAERIGFRPAEAEALSLLATALEREGRLDEAETTYHRALSAALAVGHARVMGEVSVGLVWLTGVPERPLDEAERWATHGLAALEPLGALPEAQAQLHHALAVARLNHGRLDEAELALNEGIAIREAAFGKGHHSLGAAMSTRGQLMAMRGRLDEAIEAFRAAGKHVEHEYGPRHPINATVIDNLGIALSERGDLEEARILQARALEIRLANLGLDHPDVGASHLNMAATLHALGDPAAAKVHALRALEIFSAVYGERSLELTSALTNLGNAEMQLGEHDSALAHHRLAVELAHEHLGDGHPRVGRYHHNLAGVLARMDQIDEAIAEFRTALRIRETSEGNEHPEVGQTATALADLLLQRGEADEAVALAERAVRIAALSETAQAERGDARWVLARALWESTAHRDRKRARQMAELARGDLAGEEDAAEIVGQIDAWLGQP